MSEQLVSLGGRSRATLVRRGRHLECFTIIYNSLEGLVALVAGLIAGSIALVGFGFDSLIEVTSGAVLLWCHRRAHPLLTPRQTFQRCLPVEG
jgi:hypothetical protein